jgi:uncharacterized Zn finger protein (UPF0148 family)
VADEVVGETRCPVCGTAVEVVSGDEGTSYYRPLVDTGVLRAENQRLQEECNGRFRIIKSQDTENKRMRSALEWIASETGDPEAKDMALGALAKERGG